MCSFSDLKLVQFKVI